MRVSHPLDALSVSADDDTLVADAGLLLPAVLGQRLGLPALLDVRVTAGPNAASKCLTVIHLLVNEWPRVRSQRERRSAVRSRPWQRAPA